MIKYSKQDQARLEANKQSLKLMAENDLNISNKRQGMIYGQLPEIEDQRSYAQQMADELQQTEELNNVSSRRKTIIND